MRDGFYRYHPIVNFSFFVFVILFSMFFMHPVCLFISALGAFVYSVKLNGRKAVRFNLLYLLPLIVALAIINPVFNHEGASIIAYFPNGNPLTAESVYYGGAMAVMIFCVICWFSCYNAIMTSDKFIYLFGRIIPSMSLILSMTLRFVPSFKEQFKRVSNAQKCIGMGISDQKGLKGLKNAVRIFSVMITWALENAIETADSMKSRGYGLEKRSAFSIFKFGKRDKKALFCILACGIYVMIGYISGALDFSYFPYIKGSFDLYGLSVFTVYCLLCFIPFITEVWEERKWNALQLKI